MRLLCPALRQGQQHVVLEARRAPLWRLRHALQRLHNEPQAALRAQLQQHPRVSQPAYACWLAQAAPPAPGLLRCSSVQGMLGGTGTSDCKLLRLACCAGRRGARLHG